MNDKIFDTYTDMNEGNIARNVMEPISFYLFHRQRNSTIEI
jgi:hypothetical protein